MLGTADHVWSGAVVVLVMGVGWAVEAGVVAGVGEAAALIAITPANPAKATPLAAATARRARRAGCGSRRPIDGPEGLDPEGGGREAMTQEVEAPLAVVVDVELSSVSSTQGPGPNGRSGKSPFTIAVMRSVASASFSSASA